MKQIILVLIGLIFNIGFGAFAQDVIYETNRDYQGNFEDTDAWQDDVPSNFTDVDNAMTIYGKITRNGDLKPASVAVIDTFIVDGDYKNTGGLIIGNEEEENNDLPVAKDGIVEIYGDLNSSANIEIVEGCRLIVHGNLTAEEAEIQIKGDLIVKGDFSANKETKVNPKGNLIVGGNFLTGDGSLKFPGNKGKQGGDLYILDPNADVNFPTDDGPGGGNNPNNFEKGDEGDLEAFIVNEGDNDLFGIVEEIMPGHIYLVWTGRSKDNSWSDPGNWDGDLPGNNSLVKIKEVEAGNSYPVISGTDSEKINEKIKKLVIEPGASLTIEENASLTISDSLILKSSYEKLANLMDIGAVSVPEGNTRVQLDLAAETIFYLSSPIKNAQLSWFFPEGSDLNKDLVYVYRKDPSWQWIAAEDYISNNDGDLDKMEAVYGKYQDGKVLDFSGDIYNDDVTKDGFTSGYYFVGNPYPTAIDWNKSSGWSRDGFSTSMWSWVTINGFRVIQTVNHNNDDAPIWTLSAGGDDELPEGYDKSNFTHIPPYQAVVMKVTSSDAKLTIKREARVGDSQVPLKSAGSEGSSYNLIRVQTGNDQLIDETVIYFSKSFSAGVNDEDSEKKFNSSKIVPEIYTRINNKAYAINGLPALPEGEYSLPLSVRNRVEGDVNMTVDLEEFDANYDVFLEDKETGSWIDLRTTNSYTYTPAQIGDDHDRFVLHFEKVKQIPTNVEKPQESGVDGIKITGMKDYALVRISANLLQSSEATIEVLDINGRLMNRINTSEMVKDVELPDDSGVYFVRVKVGESVKTEKIIN